MAYKRITSYLSEEEYEQVKINADKANKTVSTHMKDLILNEDIQKPIYIQTDDLLEHSKQIEEIRKDLNKLVSSELRYKEVYQEDIKKMITILNRIEHSEKLICETVLTTRKKVKSEAKKILKKEGVEIGNHKNSHN